MTYTMDDLTAFVTDRQSGAALEVDEELFTYFLEVLPPVNMFYRATLADGTQRQATFGFAEGYERVTAFWSTGGRNYAQLTTEMNRGY